MILPPVSLTRLENILVLAADAGMIPPFVPWRRAMRGAVHRGLRIQIVSLLPRRLETGSSVSTSRRG